VKVRGERRGKSGAGKIGEQWNEEETNEALILLSPSVFTTDISMFLMTCEYRRFRQIHGLPQQVPWRWQVSKESEATCCGHILAV